MDIGDGVNGTTMLPYFKVYMGSSGTPTAAHMCNLLATFDHIPSFYQV